LTYIVMQVGSLYNKLYVKLM